MTEQITPTVRLVLHDNRALSYALGMPNIPEARREEILSALAAGGDLNIAIRVIRYARWDCVQNGIQYRDLFLDLLSNSANPNGQLQILRSLDPRDDKRGTAVTRLRC